MSAHHDLVGGLAGDRGDDAALRPPMRELLRRRLLGTARRDDAFDLREKPIGRLFAVRGCVVAVVELGKGRQCGLQVGFAKLRDQTLNGRRLRHRRRISHGSDLGSVLSQ